MKELKITPPEGYEVDKERSTFERIIYKKIKKRLPKSWEELEEVSGYYLTTYSVLRKLSNENCSSKNRNIFPAKKQAKSGLLLPQLLQLRDRYRDGWIPDYTDGSVPKYTIISRGNDLIRSASSYTHTLFSFQTENIRDEFMKNFEKELLEFFTGLI